jgi:putative oxidoreductase
MKSPNVLDKSYAIFQRAAGSLASPLLLAIRVYWGWQFHTAGMGKLHNIQHVVEFFTSLGIPAPALNAYFVSGLEFVGGLMLILGLGGRLIALPLTIDMIVAYLTADREALGAIFSDPGKFYAAAPFTFLAASLIILVWGSGFFSVDHAIAWYRGRGAAANPTTT